VVNRWSKNGYLRAVRRMDVVFDQGYSATNGGISLDQAPRALREALACFLNEVVTGRLADRLSIGS